MRIVGMIKDPATARKILEHLGLPARAPVTFNLPLRRDAH
jgi:hypothetical protein